MRFLAPFLAPLLSLPTLISCDAPATSPNGSAPQAAPNIKKLSSQKKEAQKKEPAPEVKEAPSSPESSQDNPSTSRSLQKTWSKTPPTDVPRVYAKSRHVWVRSMPTDQVQWIGYLWWGGSVAIRGEKRVPGAGCRKEWIPVEPRGWVCVDGEKATTDAQDPTLLSIFPHRARIDTPWPHQYAAVNAPLRRYQTEPDEKLQKLRENGYLRHMEKVRQARKLGSTKNFQGVLSKLDPSLAGQKTPSILPLPRGLSEGHTRVVGRSAMAYVRQGDIGDRGFLLTADLNWVPKDRVQLLKPAQFKGIELNAKRHLPLAFFRGKDRPAFVRNSDGSFKKSEETFRKHAHVQLADEMVREGRTRYYRVKGEDLWVSSREAVIPTPRKKTPWGALVGQPDTTGKARKGRATWLEASILGGWLVAFEGTRAVYATMISAGRGGTPHPNKTALETASTPTGWYPIGGKFKTATMMSSSTPIVHSDVPWTQNFSGPHAIHSAYWHEDWGNLKSAGCVNLAPRDGKWLFEFTEPDVPEGWHGVRYLGRYGGGSTLFIVHE